MKYQDSDLVQGWIEQQTNLEKYAKTEFPSEIIAGVIPASSIILLSGDPKAGKSFIAQSWAHAVSTGTSWNEREVIGGRVAWVNPDGEHGRYLLDRFRALEEITGDPIDYKRGLPVIEQFLVSNAEERENILEGVRNGIRLVIIDTLAAAAGTANLSNQNEVHAIADFSKKLIQAGENVGTSVIWISHSTKSDKKSVSGSQQILAFASQQFSVVNNGGKVTLELEANRHGEAGLKISLAFEEIEFEDGRKSAAIVPSNPNRKTPIRAQTALKQIEREGHLIPGEQYPKVTWRKELEVHGISQSRAYEHLVAAAEDGILIEHPSGKQMAYSFPVSQKFPNSEMGNSQDVFPPLPESLDSGIRKKGEVEEMETF